MRSEAQWKSWCEQFFAMLADGGTWGVPRSGLVFQRQGDELVLIERMPYLPEMEGTITPEQLVEQQDGEFDTIRSHFEEARITVREKKPLR